MEQFMKDEGTRLPRQVVGEPPKKTAPRGSWPWNVTIGVVVLTLSVVILTFLWFFRRPITIFFLGLTLAAALGPVVGWLERWLPRNVATLLVYLILALILVGLGVAIIPPVVDEAQRLIESTPEYAQRAETWVENRFNLENGLPYQKVLSQVTGVASMLVALPVEISTSLFEAFLVAFIALYALLLAPQAHETLLSLFPIPQRDRVTAITQETLHVMGGYFRGASITGAIIGSLTYVGLLIIGVNFALVAALVAALAEFIPFVGPLISGAFVVTISFLQSPSKALIALIFTIALQQVESNLVAPNVMHPQTCISPLATLVAIFAGGTVGGVLGALVAIPLYAAFRVITARLILPAIRRQTGAPPRENEEVC